MNNKKWFFQIAEEDGLFQARIYNEKGEPEIDSPILEDRDFVRIWVEKNYSGAININNL
jgi:hypothetical protein